MEYKKFSEIPQFPFASYHVNMPWSGLEKWLKEEDEYFNLDMNPVYQRGYVWTEQQQISYIEYRLRGGFSGKDIFWNCKTWMGSTKKGDRLELVDGKQRIKAVLDFMDNKIKVFGNYYRDFEDKLHLIGHDFIFHVNNLDTQMQVVEWYLGMNTGGSIHTEKDLKPAYDHIESLKNNVPKT